MDIKITYTAGPDETVTAQSERVAKALVEDLFDKQSPIFALVLTWDEDNDN